MMPMAEKAARRLGVEPRYLVAQAALETGWGKSMIRQKDGSNSHNLFGIKATNWSGESAMARTTEYVNGRAVKQVEGFRAYASFEQSFDDFVSLLQNSDRYQSAVNAGGDSERFVRELQKAGYATDLNMHARSARSRGAWSLSNSGQYRIFVGYQDKGLNRGELDFHRAVGAFRQPNGTCDYR